MKRIALIGTCLLLAAACQRSPETKEPAPDAQTSAAGTTESAPVPNKGLFSIFKITRVEADDGSAPPPLDPAKIDTAKLLRTLKGELELPEGIDIRIENVRPGRVPGLAEADLVVSARGQQQQQTIYLSTDGRWVSPQGFYEPDALSPSKVPGFKTLHLKDLAGGETKELFVSNDGSLISFGEFWDTSIDPNLARMQKLTLDDAPHRGKKGAKVTFVEFSDFQCPFCSKAQQMIASQIYPEYKDRVDFRFKHLPLSFHDWARPAALAAVCATDQNQDKFWDAYNYFFDNQKQIRKTNVDQMSRDMAKAAGLNLKEFDDCYRTKKFEKTIDQDSAEANSLGISGTPAFVINGRKISGAQPYDTFKKILDEELASK